MSSTAIWWVVIWIACLIVAVFVGREIGRPTLGFCLGLLLGPLGLNAMVLLWAAHQGRQRPGQQS